MAKTAVATPVVELPEPDRLTPRPGVVLPVWTPDDGPFEGYYTHKPRGARWLACVKWVTAHGVIRPGDICPVETMTKAQMRAELEERVWQRDMDGGGDAARELLLLNEAHGAKVPSSVRAWLTRDRESRREVLAPWDLPDNIMHHIYLRGWVPAGLAHGRYREI